jgi:hypothetical protein
MTSPKVPLAPDLEAVLDCPGADLTANEIAEVLGFNPVTIREAIKAGRIGGRGHQLRAGETTGGEAMRQRLRVPKAELIAYLWRITSERTLLREVLSKRAPALLAALEKRESGRECNPALPAAPELPANVIEHPALVKRRKAAAVPMIPADHPELRLFA